MVTETWASRCQWSYGLSLDSTEGILSHNFHFMDLKKSWITRSERGVDNEEIGDSSLIDNNLMSTNFQNIMCARDLWTKTLRTWSSSWNLSVFEAGREPSDQRKVFCPSHMTCQCFRSIAVLITIAFLKFCSVNSYNQDLSLFIYLKGIQTKNWRLN